MIYRQKKVLHVGGIIFLIFVAILVLSAFVETPFRINTYSEVFPKERWLLTRGNSGQIISNLIDFSQGHTASYNISEFERGEQVSIKFYEYLKGKREFIAGDTIANIRSSNVENQLVSAKGELEIAIANLKSQNSSQKEPLIREAESKLKYTSEKIDEQKILLERASQLFQKGFTSKQEYELQKWNLNLLLIEEKIYKAQVENLSTGVKPEEVKYLESQVKAVEEKLDFLKKMISDFVLTTPISGKMISSFSPDTLLNIINYKEIILHTPVRVDDLSEFAEGQEIVSNFTGIDEPAKGKIISIDKQVKFVNGQQVVFLSVLFDNKLEKLLPGMVIENSIKLRNNKLLDQIIRLVR